MINDLVDLLLLVHRELSGTHVDQQEETTSASLLAMHSTQIGLQDLHNRENLEEVVLGKVLVGVVGV